MVRRLSKVISNDSVIPWHRVVNSQGKILFPACSEKYQE
ncbi:MGMT family protein [Pseudoalteromonas sp. NZS11]|nr:MGMT family protein [Pseudoalteromonas sp. NZS11]